MFQRILVPLDGSVRAERAIPLAAQLARYAGGVILLLHVVTHPLDTVASFLHPPEETEKAVEAVHAQAVNYRAICHAVAIESLHSFCRAQPGGSCASWLVLV